MTIKSSSVKSEHFEIKQLYQTNTVRVENISAQATANEVFALFQALIGNIKGARPCETSSGTSLEMEFFDQHSAIKSLGMSGYKIHGTPLITTHYTPISVKRQSDDRKNLYVLGLPFSLTRTEFAALFSRYGNVIHSVILATVDNSSRRRGFIVMSTNEEAKLAMSSLTRAQIKGHSLDISWAVVQRSQGFLDGGDRAMLLDSRASTGSFSQTHESPDISANSSSSSISSSEDELALLAPSLVPTPTILVTNLPMLLFSEAKDMHPLFCPFGLTKKLSVINSPSDASTSVIVEYGSAQVAQEAKETLHGEHYAGHQLVACYVRIKSSLLDLAPVSEPACYKTNASHAFQPLACRSSVLLGPVNSYCDVPPRPPSTRFY